MEYIDNLNIVFFNSPIYKDTTDDGENYLPPLGQGYIVTQLNKCGIKAGLIDCVNERMGVEDIASLINESTVSNVAFNVFSVNLSLVRLIVEHVRRNVNWFFGGKAMNSLWPIMTKWNWNDQNVIYTIGECELIYSDLLLNQCKESPLFQCKNQRVYLVDKNSVYYPNNLDLIELDRRLFENRKILNHYGYLESCLIASRGCIFNCAFCGGSQYANSNITVRGRTSNSIVSEINSIIDLSPDVESIRILDDLFLKNRTSIIQALKIFQHFPQLHWRCMGHISSLKCNTDLFPSLKEYGCQELFIGIESGAPRIRKMIHKEGSVQEIEDIIKQLLEIGIDVKGYFICGFPSESKTEMLDTVNLAKKIKHIAENTPGTFRTTAFQFRPYHGTELYDKLINCGKNIGNYRISPESSSKLQFSYLSDNYSCADESFVTECIREITKG